MNKLLEAYEILELEPGSDWTIVKKKHRLLIKVWHPDKMPTEELKLQATEKLKALNNAKDILKEHFDTFHSHVDCECQQRESTSTQSSFQDDEKRAKQNDEARRKKREKPESKEPKSEFENENTEPEPENSEYNSHEDRHNQLKVHRKFVKLTKFSITAFVATLVLLIANVVVTSAIAQTLKHHKSSDEYKHEDLSKELLNSKALYLEKSIDKKARPFAKYLKPPYEKSYENILTDYMYPVSSSKSSNFPLPALPALSKKEQLDLDSLSGLYRTKIATEKSLDILENQIKAIENAIPNAQKLYELKDLNQVHSIILTQYRTGVAKLSSINSRINSIESSIAKKYGDSRLPSPPIKESIKPYSTTNDYEYLTRKYSHLFH